MLINCENYSYEIRDKFMEKKIIPKEYKDLFKWVLSWYIDNHLKFASLESINNRIIDKYIDKPEKMVTIVYHGLSLDCLQNCDNLDKEIYNKIPKKNATENELIEE